MANNENIQDTLPIIRPIQDCTQQSKTTIRMLIKPFPRSAPISAIRKLIAERLSLPISLISLRKPAKGSYADLTIRDCDDSGGARECRKEEDLMEVLKDLSFKGQPILVHSHAPNSCVLDKNDRCLNDQVTPLWRMSYEEQLVHKQQAMQSIVNKLSSEARQAICLEPIVPSPVLNGYRNKCEFTVGLDKEGLPTVGFLLGGFREGILTVENASDTLHTHALAKSIAHRFQEFIRTSPLPFYDRKTKRGFWRLLLVRVHGTQLMVAAQAHKAADALGEAERERFRSTFKDVDSLWWQSTDAVHHGLGTAFELLCGSDSIEEHLGPLRFRISPSSFFQINVPATLKLYDLVRSFASTAAGGSSGGVLLDLCCGTGTIGMSMASSFGRVIGIECVPEAVSDALFNAQLNGIVNIEFHASRLEDRLSQLIAAMPEECDITVVLDPPRAGCHKSVIKTILQCERISRVVYVSCAPEQALPNWIQLLGNNTFTMKKAQAVDMFPHTEHCELVLLFERVAQH